MKKTQKWKFMFLVAPILALAMMAIWSAPAQATVFSFTDEYWLKDGTAFSTVFGGATGLLLRQASTSETAPGGYRPSPN